MTFWGVKVNPGKPFSHNSSDTRHRLHLSQATLDLGPATKKVSVQCNVGKRSPVLLCSLLPDKWESCPLSLEFQESDDVTFSVIGPRSVYLTGYYVDVDSRSHTNADSESYGEDIVNTDCEKSLRSTDEEDYEDSFINDGDPDVLSSSSLSTGKGDDPKPKFRKEKLRRLRKCTLNVSGDDDNSYTEICNTNGQTFSGTNSDHKADIEQTIGEITVLPECSNLRVGEAVGSDEKIEELCRNEVGVSVEDDKSRGEPVLAAKVMAGSGKRKRRKNRGGDGLQGDADLCQNMPSLVPGEMDSILNSECGTASGRKSQSNYNTKGEAISETDKVNEKSTLVMDNTGRDKTSPGPESKSHVSEILCDIQERPRKRKKQCHDNGNSDILEVHAISKGDVKVVTSNDTLGVDEECNNFSLDKGIHLRHGRREKLNRKKKIESNKVEGTICGMVVSPTAKEKSVTLNNTAIRSDDITIEEIEVGDAEGKIASLGKKVRIHYVGRLRGDEQIIHSSVEQGPFRFRLGGATVIEGWNVGVEGMRVGGKRKLIIPPSMAYGREGDGGKIPPDSWLEYDVELVRVH